MKKDYKNASQDELKKTLEEKRAELQDLRFKDASGQLKNVRAIRAIRKEIARIQTALSTKNA